MSQPGTWPVTLRIGTIVLSGLLFAASFPPFLETGAAAALASLVLLLPSLRGAAPRQARGLGFLWGMVAYGTSLSWFWNLFQWPTVALWAILAVFVSAFAWMQCRADARGLTGWRWVAFTTLNWCGWEFIRAELFPLKFPWMTPGLACGPNYLLSFIGVYGVSAIMVLSAAFIVGPPGRSRGTSLLQIAVGLGLWGILFPKPGLVEVDPARSAKVAALQEENVSVDQFLKRTAALPKDVKLIVWPEYSIPYDLRTSRDMPLVANLSRQRNSVLVVGTRTTTHGGDPWFNTALTLEGNTIFGEHHKAHPVHFFNDGTPGTTALPVKTPLGSIGTPICFDCDYEGIVRRMTAAGAGFFAVPTMDAESWSAREHLQHAQLFRIRACENARWFLVCASSGVSQIIDSHGVVHEHLAPLTSGNLVGSMNSIQTLTFYTRAGWLLPWVIFSAAIVCWVALWIPRGTPK